MNRRVLLLNLNLFKRSVLEEIGGLNEDYLFGFQEAYLLLKIRPLGYRVVMVGGPRVFHYDRLTKTLNESNLDQALYKADVDRWYSEYPEHAAPDPVPTPVLYWKAPFTTNRRTRLVWWLAFHIPFKGLRRRAIDAAMWIEPILTRYPANKSARFGEVEAQKIPEQCGHLAGHLPTEDFPFTEAVGNSLVATTGDLHEDGWLGEKGSLEFMAVGATAIEIEGEFPDWSKLESQTLRADSDSRGNCGP